MRVAHLNLEKATHADRLARAWQGSRCGVRRSSVRIEDGHEVLQQDEFLLLGRAEKRVMMMMFIQLFVKWLQLRISHWHSHSHQHMTAFEHQTACAERPYYTL